MNHNLKFATTRADFFQTLSQRVNAHFKNNNLPKTANGQMVFKTMFMFLLYFIPYFIIVLGVVTNIWAMLGLCFVMGLGMAGIGLSIMHDANHGSYSTKSWVNQLLGISLNLVGGHALNWKVQHNVLHHTYTNVHDVDEDISPRGVLRMAPGSEWRPMHKYQHLYAWFFYGLLTLVWVLVKDFTRLSKYEKEGLLKKQKTNATNELIFVIISKLLYFTYIFAVPLLVLPLTWWQVLIGFFVMHYLSGFILAIIFQPAHVIDGTEYPMPDDQGNLENNWAIHQLHTTTNFANKNKLLSWYVGGLNYQVEHHLFPNVCHIHYRNIAPIVEQTAKEFGLPYKTKETFLGALAAHAKLMKALGAKPDYTAPLSVA
ncbi:MAG: acyl-CoA desaturase [Bacteroidetes bacterium]|nr:acyl-CoA desaturase [Bacteroidota bacterium]